MHINVIITQYIPKKVMGQRNQEGKKKYLETNRNWNTTYQNYKMQ